MAVAGKWGHGDGRGTPPEGVVTGGQGELQLRLDDARKGQLKAGRVLLEVGQLVLMLLSVIASLQERCRILEIVQQEPPRRRPCPTPCSGNWRRPGCACSRPRHSWNRPARNVRTRRRSASARTCSPRCTSESWNACPWRAPLPSPSRQTRGKGRPRPWRTCNSRRSTSTTLSWNAAPPGSTPPATTSVRCATNWACPPETMSQVRYSVVVRGRVADSEGPGPCPVASYGHPDPQDADEHLSAQPADTRFGPPERTAERDAASVSTFPRAPSAIPGLRQCASAPVSPTSSTRCRRAC